MPDQTIEERVATLEQAQKDRDKDISEIKKDLGDLTGLIGDRIAQESEFQEQANETIKATIETEIRELEGDFKALKTAVTAHCSEQRVTDGRIEKTISEIFRQLRTLESTITSAVIAIKASPSAQAAAAEPDQNVYVEQTVSQNEASGVLDWLKKNWSTLAGGGGAVLLGEKIIIGIKHFIQHIG